jgi:hypothetical protein
MYNECSRCRDMHEYSTICTDLPISSQIGVDPKREGYMGRGVREKLK